MANPILCRNILINGSSGSGPYTTARCAVEPSRLLLLGVLSSRSGAAPSIPTVTGLGLTWVQQDTILFDTSATQRRLTVFRAYGSGAISGTLSIDFSSETQAGAHWSLIELAFSDDTSGTNGSVAAVQSANAAGSSTTPSVTLGTFGDTDNATIGFVAHTGTGAVTAGTGFGRVNNLGFNGMALAAEFVATNDTSVDGTVASSAWGIIGIEVKAAADPSIPTSLPAVMGSSSGASIFVSTAGNDTTGDGSIGNPYLSISKALTVVGASDIIEVRYDSGAAHVPSGTAGTAAGERFTCSIAGKSRAEPITIRTYPSDLSSGKALINGEFYVGSSTNEMVGNYKFQNLVIKKRTAADNGSSTAGDYGVRVEISRNVEVSDCEITDNNQGGILVGGSAAFMGVEGVQIFRNRIHATGSNGTNHNSNLKHDHCVYWGGGAANSVYGGAVYNNLMYVTRYGFCLHPWGSGGTGFSCKHSIFAYNTCYDSDTINAASGNSVSIMGGGSSGAIENVYTSNILKKSGTLGVSYGLEWDGAGTGNLFKYLLIHEVRDGDFDTAVSSHGTLSNNITGQNPLLTDPANGDFTITTSSPAYNAGEAAYMPAVDFFGTTRVTPDIGAVAVEAAGIGTPQLIGSFDSDSDGANNDCVITVPAGGVPAGAIVFLAIVDTDEAAAIDSITDSGGNTYTVRKQQGHTDVAVRGYIATGTIVTGLTSGQSITVSFDAYNFVGIYAYYVTGLHASGYLGAASAQIDFATSYDSGGIVVPTADETILFGLNTSNQDTLTYSSTGSFTELHDVQLAQVANRMQTQYRIVSAAATYDSTATLTDLDDGAALQIAWGSIAASVGEKQTSYYSRRRYVGRF